MVTLTEDGVTVEAENVNKAKRAPAKAKAQAAKDRIARAMAYAGDRQAGATIRTFIRLFGG